MEIARPQSAAGWGLVIGFMFFVGIVAATIYNVDIDPATSATIDARALEKGVSSESWIAEGAKEKIASEQAIELKEATRSFTDKFITIRDTKDTVLINSASADLTKHVPK